MINKKVCILSSVHPAFDIRIFHKQAKTLVKAGYDVTLIVQHDKNEIVEGVNIIGLPKPKNRIERIFGLTWKVMRIALKQKYDIYHFHDPELLMIGCILKLFTRRKVIYDIHENYPEDIKLKFWIPRVLRKPIANVYNMIEKTFGHCMDGIITVNDVINQRFKKCNSIEIRNYPIIDFPYYKTIKTSNSITTLIYAGGINKIRGIYELVQSLEFVNKEKNICLKLYGKFQRPEFEQEVRNLNGFSKVSYGGVINIADVWQNLMSADMGFVLFHPSKHSIGAMPNKLFEYMSAGIPVICSNFDFWKEIVQENQCGLMVDPLKPQEIADAIKYLMDNPEIAKEMGENGRKAVIEKYSWKSEGEKLVGFYKNLLK